MGRDREDLRQQALQVAAQLPAKREDALIILELAKMFISMPLGAVALENAELAASQILKIVG